MLLLFCVTVAAQKPGSISGRVTGAGSSGIVGAPIQAMNVDTNTPYRTLSGSGGEYSITGLPAGTYTVTLKYPGFRYLPFTQMGVSVSEASAVKVDIKLGDGNFGTLGDDPFTYNHDIRERAAKLTGPVPRTADGHPDLSGVWNGNDDLYPEDPALKPWVAAKAKELIANNFKDLPGVSCLPSTLLPNGPFLRKFVQTPALLVILTEDDVIGFRQIYLDGRKHPTQDDAFWLGHSIGHWEGDTLVVDRANFNDKGVVDMYAHTEQLHLIERYRRTDYGHMQVDVTVEDPGAFDKPWHVHMVWDLAPDEDVMEYVCAENNIDAKHLVGK
ncbi:MAG TPA: carboxypeptidase-like regulatory domain-containing protein [Bryobacteraceae bacterium]|nr:carboxypeptidase-like regulatory domain-containing protein [Bryobacteraceae bacterium]